MPRRTTHLLVAALLLSGGAGYLLGQSRSSIPPDETLFAVVYTPGESWDTTLAPSDQRHFAAHSANLVRLRSDSVIVAGGRFGRWGLLIVEAQDAAAARELLEADSSIASGTFRADVYRWTTTFEGFVKRR